MMKERCQAVSPAVGYLPGWGVTRPQEQVRILREALPGIKTDPAMDFVIRHLLGSGARPLPPHADGVLFFPTMDVLGQLAAAAGHTPITPLDKPTSYLLSVVNGVTPLFHDFSLNHGWPEEKASKTSPLTAHLLHNAPRYGDLQALPFNAGSLYAGQTPCSARMRMSLDNRPPVHLIGALSLFLTNPGRWAPGAQATDCLGTIMPHSPPRTTPRSLYLGDNSNERTSYPYLAARFDNEAHPAIGALAFIPW